MRALAVGHRSTGTRPVVAEEGEAGSVPVFASHRPTRTSRMAAEEGGQQWPAPTKTPARCCDGMQRPYHS